MKEADLYNPLRSYFEAQGYSVHSEVKNCDMVLRPAAGGSETGASAEAADGLIVVELKTRMSLQLLLQGVKRQELSDSVYLAVALQRSRGYPANYGSMKTLLRRLGLGLIFVRFMKTRTRIEVVLHPDDPKKFNRPSRARALLREIDGRYAEFNRSGEAVKVEKITAYKQQALYTAVLLGRLCEDGPVSGSPAQLKSAGAPQTCGRILSSNVYGWFDRVEKGQYLLSDAGREALKQYSGEIEKIVEAARIQTAADGDAPERQKAGRKKRRRRKRKQ
jgi:hypothetical protein